MIEVLCYRGKLYLYTVLERTGSICSHCAMYNKQCYKVDCHTTRCSCFKKLDYPLLHVDIVQYYRKFYKRTLGTCDTCGIRKRRCCSKIGCNGDSGCFKECDYE